MPDKRQNLCYYHYKRQSAFYTSTKTNETEDCSCSMKCLKCGTKLIWNKWFFKKKWFCFVNVKKRNWKKNSCDYSKENWRKKTDPYPVISCNGILKIVTLQFWYHVKIKNRKNKTNWKSVQKKKKKDIKASEFHK